MENFHTLSSPKVTRNSNAIAEIGETELTNMARKFEALKGDGQITPELRNFAIEVARVCAGIVDHIENHDGTAGDEIRRMFKIGSRSKK